MDIAANSTLKEQSDTEKDVEPDGNSEDNSDGDGMEQSYRLKILQHLELAGSQQIRKHQYKIQMASPQNFMNSYGLKDYDLEDWSNSSV